MNKKQIDLLFKTFEENNPNPKGELNYSNEYTLLVAVALSAQATDKSVNKATESLFQVVRTPKDMLELGLNRLIEHIKSIGLYNTKAKNVIAAANILEEKYNGKVPNEQKKLEELPGVGRKTANVVRNIAFGEDTIAVDTHIFRLSNRIGLAKGKTALAVEKELIKVVPKKYIINSHHWLILHGRYICVARKPKCEQCIINNLCESYSLSRKD